MYEWYNFFRSVEIFPTVEHIYYLTTVCICYTACHVTEMITRHR